MTFRQIGGRLIEDEAPPPNPASSPIAPRLSSQSGLGRQSRQVIATAPRLAKPPPRGMLFQVTQASKFARGHVRTMTTNLA